MAQIATLLSDRARREGSAFVCRADLDLVESLELGQVVIIEDTSTGERLLGWISDVLEADTETVYKFGLGPVLPTDHVNELRCLPRRSYGLQDVEDLLDDARDRGLHVPKPRRPEDDLPAEDG